MSDDEWADVLGHAWAEVDDPHSAAKAWATTGWSAGDAAEWLTEGAPTDGYQPAGEWAHHPRAARAMQIAGFTSATDASRWCDTEGLPPHELAAWIDSRVANPYDAAKLRAVAVTPLQWKNASTEFVAEKLQLAEIDPAQE